MTKCTIKLIQLIEKYSCSQQAHNRTARLTYERHVVQISRKSIPD